MRKIIVAMSNSDPARRFMEKAKKTPGVRYVQRYMVGVIITAWSQATTQRMLSLNSWERRKTLQKQPKGFR